MIKGSITLEDIVISFENDDTGNVTFEVSEPFDGTSEQFTVPQDKFFKALAIAVHNDGMPNADLDYPDAESIMGKIRWIP